MRWIIRISLGLIGVLLGVTMTVAAIDQVTAPRRPDLAPLIERARAYDVTIRRDRYGVPHILGKTNADAAFGIAFAHAEDDFATIQSVALATRGTLAASEGLKAAPGDYIVNLLDVWGTVNGRYDRDLPADVKAMLQAYADGVNYYAARNPDQVTPGLLPLTGKDIAAGFVFKTPFFYGLDSELKKLASASPDTLPKGSNGVAVAPSRSPDGATRLLVNSHQPYTGPVAWYEAVVESGEGWHVAGGFFPGTPFMLHGHNAHLGWANTVNSPDLVDIYRLTINPDDKDEYRLDGRWRKFEKSTARMRIKFWGPFSWTVNREVLRSAHGPVMRNKNGVFAIRYAGMGDVRLAMQYWRLNQAENLDQWRAAMALQALPSINYIYADERGHVGYVYNGLFPNRQEGIDWSGVVPGDRSDLIWHGYLPFDRTPQVWDPKGGLVFNANNTPFQATAFGDGLDPNSFSPTMGIQTNMTNRARRLVETFAADDQITAEEFRAYKYDLAYSPRSAMTGVISEILALDPKGDADVIAAQAVLRSWDFRTDVKSRAAALAVMTATPVIVARDAHEKGPTPLKALRASITLLKDHFGRIDPEWGQVNRLRRGAVDVPIDGGPDVLRAVYGKPGEDGRLNAVAGDTFIMFVTWDRKGQLSSESIHQFGSATLDANSPHYADQARMFAEMKVKPVLFTEAQLAGNITETYRPGQRK
ncbi:MAG: acylase [Caulobacter sp.]|nr:acylase [Caulobacter sp.]